MLVFVVAGIEYGHHIAGYADMAGGIAAVGGNCHFEGVVLFEMEIFFGRHSDRSVVGKHHNACVVRAQLKLVGSTKHAFAHSAAQFAFFDFVELGVGSIDLGTNLGANYFLPGSHIGGSADNIERGACTYIYCGEVQVVAVGMGLAGKHLGYDHMLQSAFDAFNFLNAFNFQTTEG